MADFNLHLVLTCSATGTVSHGQLSLKSLPPLAIDLKKAIEREHQIPSFAQTLSYDNRSSELADADNLHNALLRHGDTVWVTYTAAAECREVERVVEYLQKLVAHFREELPSANGAPSESATQLGLAFSGDIAHLLTDELFTLWNSEVKQMNKDLFVHNKGLHHLIELHRLLLSRDWDMNTYNMKRFEFVILKALYFLAATFKFRRLLLQQGVVELCMCSLLRTKLERKATLPLGTPLPSVIASAMGTLCNMCEVHETNVKIGSNPEALEQFICIAYSPDYTIWCAQLAFNLFVCLSQASEVHPHLVSDSTVGGLMDVCQYRSELSTTNNAMDLTLLRYFVQLVFIQLVLLSHPSLSFSMLQRMDHHMSTFHREVEPEALSKHEESTGSFWSVFEPFVRLLYVPHTPLAVAPNEEASPSTNPPVVGEREPLVCRLQFLSISTTLTALHMMFLNREEGHKCFTAMQQENLIPFIVLAPSYVPPSLKSEADNLVQCVGHHTSIQPPSLADHAKAALAKFQFGLERMLRLKTPHELVEEYYGRQF